MPMKLDGICMSSCLPARASCLYIDYIHHVGFQLQQMDTQMDTHLRRAPGLLRLAVPDGRRD